MATTSNITSLITILTDLGGSHALLAELLDLLLNVLGVHLQP